MKMFFRIWIFAAAAAQIYNPPTKRNFYTYESSTDWPSLALSILQWTLPAIVLLVYYQPLSTWLHQRRRVLALFTATAAILTLAAFVPDMWTQSRAKAHTMTAEEFLDAPNTTPAPTSCQQPPATRQAAQANPPPALISPEDRILIRTYPGSANQTRRAEPVSK